MARKTDYIGAGGCWRQAEHRYENYKNDTGKPRHKNLTLQQARQHPLLRVRNRQSYSEPV
jgi:hypothetical protein